MCKKLKKLPSLLTRKGHTQEHKKAWEEFNLILEARANVAMLLLFFGGLSKVLNGIFYYKPSEEYLEDCTACNKEAGEMILPYSKVILQAMLAGRLVLVLVSLWYPKITRCYIYY